METIKEWADRKKVGVSLAKRMLRDAFPGKEQEFSSPDKKLGPAEVGVLEAAMERRSRTAQGVAEQPATDDASAGATSDTDPVLALDISRVERVPARRGAGETRFYLHPDFFEWFSDAPPAPQRAAVLRALESMAANGRPNRVKGVKGVNQGWLRTPAGGTRGMQWYLWYAGRGSKPVGDRVGEGEFLIRAVRHHDETEKVISAGDPESWMPWSLADLLEEYDRDAEDLARPLTTAQRAAARSESPVQVVRGTPGAGKTTAILHGVRHLPGRVLYLTYGRALADRARNWLRSFATSDAVVQVEAMSDVLGALAGVPAPRDPLLSDIRGQLSRLLGARTRELAPWCDATGLDHLLLYDELHGHVFGRVTHAQGVGLQGEVTRPLLPIQQQYVDARRSFIGADAARAAWRAASGLDDSGIAVLFPGPATAHRAIARLAAGAIPTTYAELDWIVIDEAQDMTLVEAEALVELARAVATRTGKRPGLRFAGDEGQTLRPTAFTWADVKQLLSLRAGDPATSVLDSNLRSAREVALFVEQLTRATYPLLKKGLRPGGQRRAEVDPVEGGEVSVLRVERAQLAVVLAAARSAGAIIQPGRELALDVAQAAETAGVLVQTGEHTKGLDFDSVVVLGLGDVVAEVRRLAKVGEVEELSAERARSLADHARVAASRAVSRLVLVEFDDAGDRRSGDSSEAIASVLAQEVGEHSLDVAEERASEITMEVLEERLEADTGDAISRLVDAVRLSENLLDRDPDGALKAADDAGQWLRRSGRSSAVGDEIRQQVHRQRARARVVLAVRGVDAADPGARELLFAAQRAFRAAGDAIAADTVSDLAAILRPEESGGIVERLRQALDACGALTAHNEAEPWLTRTVEPVMRASTARLAGSATPSDVQQARPLLELLDCVRAGGESAAAAVASATLRTLDVLAGSASDARMVLDRLRDASSAEALRVRAHALSTLHDPSAPDAWATAGDSVRGLATLRQWGEVRKAVEFATNRSLPVPEGLAAVAAMLDALDVLAAAPLESEEARQLRLRMDEVLPEPRSSRGRRGPSSV